MTNEQEGPAQAAGLNTSATDRVLAFLDQWPGPHNDDEIYRIYASGIEYSLTKSDILEAIRAAKD